MPNLANNRTRKNTLNFTPSKAYWLSGHGGEPNDGRTFIVPPGCIIVVKVTPGEYSYVYNDYAKKLSSMDKNKLKDPLKNTNYLIQNFGSIAIFKPGDNCPLFNYYLLACFPASTVNYSKGVFEKFSSGCNNLGSGVIDIDNIIKPYADIVPITDINIDTYTANLYEKSEYPTKEKIQSEIAKFSSEISLPSTSLQKFSSLVEKLDSVLDVNQKTLCETLGKGVYYNFICRYRGKETNVLYGNVLTNTEGHRHSSVKGIEELGGTQVNTLRLIRNRIAEAETRRKGLLRNYYTSPEYLATNMIDYSNLKFNSPSDLYSLFNKLKEHPQLRGLVLIKIKNIENYRGEFTVDELVNYVDSAGNSPLSIAVAYQFPDLIFPLILLGAKTDILVNGKTLMDLAINTNNPIIVEKLKLYMNKTRSELLKIQRDENQIELKRANMFKYSMDLYIIILSKQSERALSILKNLDDYRGQFTIDEIVNYLSTSGETPLSAAIETNQKELILHLMMLGAKTEIIVKGKPLLELTENEETRNELLKYLGKTPAELKDVYYKEQKGKTARNLKQPINWLGTKFTQKNTSQNIIDFDDFESILFFRITTSIRGSTTIEDLLKLIKQINNSNFNETLARKSRYKYISSKNNIINFNNPYGNYGEETGATPLWLAVKYNKSELIKPLLQAGANTEVVVSGQTLLEIAKEPVASLLRRYSKKTPAEINLLNKQDANAAAAAKKAEEEKTAAAAAQKAGEEKAAAAAEKEKQIIKLLSYYAISREQKDALHIKLTVFTIKQINAKIQTFLDKNAQVAANLAAKEKKKGILGFFGLGRTRRRTRKN